MIEEYPFVKEMHQRALKIKHRHRRAIEVGNARAAVKAEIEGARLWLQLDALQRLAHGYFEAQKLLAVLEERQAQKEAASRSLLRRSYRQDAWQESLATAEGAT